MEQRDALFVINQDVKPSALNELCRREHICSAILLTTHRAFSTEQDMLNKITNDVKIISFSDFLTEADMLSCDERAEQLLSVKNDCSASDYNSHFISISLSEKNRIVHEKITLEYKFNKIFYMPDLGVSETYWRKQGASFCFPDRSLKIMSKKSKIIAQSLNPFLRTARLVKNFLYPSTWSVIHDNGKAFVFLSPLKRLRIRSEIPIKYVSNRYFRFLDKNVYCMAMHGYDHSLAKKLGGVLIFVDGYHPSNYPRSYIDSYGENDVFVVRTMIDERWFTAYGRKTMRPPAFLESELFAPCMVDSANRVLIALNHAGDWTALINRSDTDELVLAAARIAGKLPEIVFRIRLHPTMNHPTHEGLHSSARIEHFVRSMGLSNLHISTHSLPEDLEWSDICLSEYSQVLLDALRIGKFGVAVNLTRRRSFMQDYATLGFPHAQNLDSAFDILQYMNAAPGNAAIQQNKAVMLYNEMLGKWLSQYRA